MNIRFLTLLLTLTTTLIANHSIALNETQNNAALGSTAPNIQGITIDGKEFNLSVSSHEQPLLILFSDSLCPFHHLPRCEEKIAEFNKIRIKYDNKIKFLHIIKSYYTDKSAIDQYMKKFAIDAPSIWDTENVIFTHYKVFANPYVVVINNAGIISYRTGDFINNLDEKIAELVK